MKKRILAIVLSTAMLSALFAGSAGAAGSTQGDPDEITVRFECFGTVPADLQLVEDAINEITIPEINVKVSYEAISAASYDNQIALDMTSGEKLDVFFSFSYTNLLSSNQLLDLSPYMDEYGQDIIEAVGEDWLKATSVGDALYAVPALCGKANALTVALRTDILEKYDLVPEFEQYDDFYDEGMQLTFQQLADIYEVVKENEEDLIILYNSGDILIEDSILMDSLTDKYGVLMGNDNYDVVNLYETEEFYDVLSLLREWNQLGYIKSDAATDTEDYTTYAKAGRLFSVFQVSGTGLDTQLKNSTGYDYTCLKINNPLISSSSLSGLIWGVSSTTDEPEASVKFLNLAYSNSELSNLMMYGVQGVHWEYAEDGTVAYAEGLSADTSGYPFSTYWEMPNSLIGDPLEGNAPDYNQQLQAENEAAISSIALGFAFDESPVKTQCSLVSAVMSEYSSTLLTGSLDLEANYDTFLSRLKDAGIDDIIAEKQAQLDAWCEENGIER